MCVAVPRRGLARRRLDAKQAPRRPGAPALVALDLVALTLSRWQLPAARTILRGMDTAPRPADSASAARLETEAERQRRLAWEAEMIAEADADIAAGRLIDAAEIDAWIDSIGTDHELPPPRSGR